jgi:AraC-like DNA-binding protein
VSDLRPGYRELAASGGLACLWVRIVGDERDRTDVLPDGCSDLIWSAGRGAFVAGPDTGPAPVSSPPGSVLLGVRFRPGAGGAALGLPLSELRDRRVDLADLRPELAAHLDAELEPRAAAAVLSRLAAELARAPRDAEVEAAVARLADPRARVEALAGELGLSERQLRRRFHAAAGYGPKTLQRVLRFRRFLAGDRADLARAALDAGYADQAHLARECARLAGTSPPRLPGLISR